LDALLRRLTLEERELARKLAELEDQVRQFEDVDRPAYEAWLSLEFGPELSRLEELYSEIRALRLRVQRIEELIDHNGLHPREALYVADRRKDGETGGSSTEEDSRDEAQARRKARKEAKREARRESKKERRRAEKEREAGRRPENPASTAPRRKLVTLYRSLARKLHPDSSEFVSSDLAQRLWLDVQAAYERADYERLLSIATWLDQEGGGSGDPGTSARTVSERRERIRALGISRYRLQKSAARLTEHPAWGFVSRPAKGSGARAKLRKRVARELEQELERAQDALAAYEDFIESIGPPRRPRRRDS
jgi:hypothetical protein